jgi:hypothetical protein
VAIIDPDGLFNGERLARCSDEARLYWPYLYVASNSYARIELDYQRILSRVFHSFSDPPSEIEFWTLVREYQDNFLLLAYEFDGQMWGQWDTDEQYLPRYHSVKDKRGPAPDKKLLAEFKKSYRISKNSAKVRKISLGVGVGVGIGEGVGTDFETPSNEELDMSRAAKEIPNLCRQILGRDAEKNQFTWSKIKELEADHGGFAVVRVFTAWAEANKLVEFQAPVAAFLKEADDLLGDSATYTSVDSLMRPQETKTLDDLCADMRDISDQSFTGKLRSAIAALLALHSASEILEAWKEYVDPMDDNDRRFAPKKFCEGAAVDILTVRRRRAERAAAQTALISEIEKREQAKAETENVVEEEIEEPL